MISASGIQDRMGGIFSVKVSYIVNVSITICNVVSSFLKRPMVASYRPSVRIGLYFLSLSILEYIHANYMYPVVFDCILAISRRGKYIGPGSVLLICLSKT